MHEKNLYGCLIAVAWLPCPPYVLLTEYRLNPSVRSSMSIDSRTFRKAMGVFPTGVTVVTTKGAGDRPPIGVTISSFTSVSLEPPLVLFCLDLKNSELATFVANGSFAVNMLREDQRELSIRFAARAEDNRFADLDYAIWDSGAPILGGCLANLECRVVRTHEEGDHMLFIGEVTRLEYSQAGQPLAYWRGAYARLGDGMP